MSEKKNDDARKDLYDKAKTSQNIGEAASRQIWNILGGSSSNYPTKD
jgi:hypothetical protein